MSVLKGVLEGSSVKSVTGLNTDNTDPANPIVKISVDGTTITGAGTPASPLVASGGGIPGGAPTEVQFHSDTDTFGGISGSAVDNVNRNVGFNQSSPEASLHAGSASLAISPPTNLTAAISALGVATGYELGSGGKSYTINAYRNTPSLYSSAATVNFPDPTSNYDPNSASSSFNYSGSGFTSNGTTFSYQIWAVYGTQKSYNGTYTATGSDDNSGNPFQVEVSWNAPPVTPDQYLMQRTRTGTDNDTLYLLTGNTSTSFTDYNSGSWSSDPGYQTATYAVNIGYDASPDAVDGYLLIEPDYSVYTTTSLLYAQDDSAWAGSPPTPSPQSIAGKSFISDGDTELVKGGGGRFTIFGGALANQQTGNIKTALSNYNLISTPTYDIDFSTDLVSGTILPTANGGLGLNAVGAANTILCSDGTSLAWTYSINQNLQTTNSPTFAGATLSGATASTIAGFDASKNLVTLPTSTYPSFTELSYVKNVTSAIQTQFSGKQATLVSGTNIKTVNSTSLLGSGDVAVQATLVSGMNIKTINGSSILGTGNLTITSGVTALSIASANGFAGTSSGGATPALTLSTTITGLLKGNGTAISAAVAGTDYQAAGTYVTGATDSSLTLTSTTLKLNLANSNNFSTVQYINYTASGYFNPASFGVGAPNAHPALAPNVEVFISTRAVGRRALQLAAISGQTASTFICTDAFGNPQFDVRANGDVSINSLLVGGNITIPGTNTYSFGTGAGSTCYLRNTSSGQYPIYCATPGDLTAFNHTNPQALLHGIKTTEQLRLGYDASNYLSVTVGSTGSATLNCTGTNPAIILGKKGRTAGYTVATLPAGVQGDFAHVTDALAPVYGAAVVGGGTVPKKVWHDGTNWTVD